MRASLRTLRFILYLPSAGLQSAVRQFHFNFRNNRATPAEAPFGHTQLPHPLRTVFRRPVCNRYGYKDL